MQRIVVVGASLGGLRAAEAVRGAGFAGEVVVVGQEPYLPYNRPPLTKEALTGGVDHAVLEYRRRRSVQDVSWRLGVPAVAADLADHTVTLADAQVLPWDGLVVATGLRSRRLEDLGVDVAPVGGRHAVRTLDDAAALRADLLPGRRVVVLGAGFVGCEVAAAAVALGCSVDVVAPEAEPLERPLGPLVGAAVRRRHEARGVRFSRGRVLARLEPGPAAAGADGDLPRVGCVELDDGTRHEADVVVEALGSLPNTEWLAPGGAPALAAVRDGDLDLTDGVRTDGWMRALTRAGIARADVVAVGDVARFPNALFDDVPRRVEHWSIPTDTARRAGPALVAGLTGREPDPAPFRPVPSFWSDQYGLRLQAFGAPGLADEVRLLQGDLDGEFVVGYLRAGSLVGVVGIGLLQELLALRAELAGPAGG